MKTMTTNLIKTGKAIRREHPMVDLLLRVAATLAWNAF